MADFDALDARLSGGPIMVAGRYVSDLGPVTKYGNRIIMAVAGEDDGEWEDGHADWLAQLAREALSGRTATIFEGRILNKVFARPIRSIESLASQFGISPALVYRIIDDAKVRIMELIIKKAMPGAARVGETCPTCGRVYETGNFSPCKRGYGPMAQFSGNPSIDPECIPPRWRKPGVEKHRAPAS